MNQGFVGESRISTLMDGVVGIRKLTNDWLSNPQPFLVYCWDFSKQDYSLAWASEPRMTGTQRVKKISLDNGTAFIVAPEQNVLMRDGKWKQTGDIVEGDELMPFYRLRPLSDVNKLKIKQFPRIFTFSNGWVHERQFVDEWRTGKKDHKLDAVNRAGKCLAAGVGVVKTAKMVGHQWNTIAKWIKAEGFMSLEFKHLGQNPDRRRVLGVHFDGFQEIYSICVKTHANLCGDSCVFEGGQN
jgi:hypothetical protein